MHYDAVLKRDGVPDGAAARFSPFAEKLLMLDQIVAIAILIVFPTALLYAAVTDYLRMEIPNRISLALICAFFVLAPLAGYTLIDIGISLLAATIVFAACFALFAINQMGAGDAKLLTAASLWFGLGPQLTTFLILVTFAGGVITLIFLVLRTRFVASKGLVLPAQIVASKDTPYAIAIAIGGLAAFWDTTLASVALTTF